MSFPVNVIKPGAVAGTFYVPDTSKVKDALNSAGITQVGSDEEIFLNGNLATLNDDLMPPVTSPDKVEILKKSAPDTITIIPKGSGA